MMKLLPILILFITCQEPKSSEKQPVVNEWDKEGWALVWNDEFDGPALNLEKWSYEIGGHGWGNNELQYYSDDDSTAFIQDGKLVIRADLVPQGTGSSDNLRYFSSARLRTSGKGDWRYGRIEVKAKLALGQGIWPAIWMLPTDWMYGGWPESGEIDIMEHVGYDPGRVHGSIHTGSYNHKINTQRGGSKLLDKISSKFYVYAIEWYEDRIDFLIDDSKYFSFQNDGKNDFNTWPFNQRFHLLINIAVGGDWPGSPDETTQFPTEMEVEYVRVYEKIQP
ncbi:MAG: glycoside hydrolase family 16 protein [Candidatus Neomarinimicrobiota bacterium]|jgi:beta-glucanase (GH16 family)|nr:glycoside hydrolase family 16 protein [Candidatus Neomarinimicrobiota bacterium]|tara:strand:- start:1257 stop:2093 length:837 start_codon:yes stop_codon:yes gene_type:complete